MSLNIDVDINGYVIFSVSAQRVSNTGGFPADDAVSDYKITSRVGYNYPVEHGIIQHRYGDGGNVLAQKALAFAGEHGV